MDATPNTLNYMVAGYIIFAVVMSVYVASLISRWRNLRRENEILNEIDQKKN